MESQSNNPFSYHSEESEDTSRLHTEPSFTDSESSTILPDEKEKSTVATGMRRIGRKAVDVLSCIIYIFIGSLFLIAGGALTFYTISHPGEYDSPRIFFGVLGVSLFFVFCGALIILCGIKFVWKKPKS